MHRKDSSGNGGSANKMNQCSQILLLVTVVLAYNCLFFAVLHWQSGKYSAPGKLQPASNCSEENPCVHLCNGEGSDKDDPEILFPERVSISAKEINASWDYDKEFRVVRGIPCEDRFSSLDDENYSFFVLTKVSQNKQLGALDANCGNEF